MSDTERWAIGITITTLMSILGVVGILLWKFIDHIRECRDWRAEFAEKLGRLEGK